MHQIKMSNYKVGNTRKLTSKNHAKFYNTVIQMTYLPVFSLYEWDRSSSHQFPKMADASVCILETNREFK